MNIVSPFSFKNLKKIALNKKFINFSGLKLNTLDKDTVSFTANVNSCNNKNTLKNLANEVNELLEEGDDITAFEKLGYDVDSDFETDKITLHGSYIPYLAYNKTGTTSNRALISYEELGINEEKLLENVEKIECKRYYEPIESELNDLIELDGGKTDIERTVQREIYLSRINRANAELKKDNSLEALKILGVDAVEDEEGNITINGDYKLGESLLSWNCPRVDEAKLLKHVTAIKGQANFDREFTPDHYIDAEEYNWHSRDKFLFTNPKFQNKLIELQNIINSGDNFTALQKMGYKVEKDENGLITIDGDYEPIFKYSFKGENIIVPYKKAGIDDKTLLNNVKKIKGSANFIDSKIENLENIEIEGDLTISSFRNYYGYMCSSINVIGKNVKVGGNISCPRMNPDILFNNYISEKEVSKQYENISREVVNKLCKLNILRYALKDYTHDKYYFETFEGANKDILDDISARKEDILTSDEVCQKYDISYAEFCKLVKGARIKPYLLDKLPNDYDLSQYLYDMSDKNNQAIIKVLELRKAVRNNNEISKDTDCQTDALVNEVKAKLAKTEFDIIGNCWSANILEQLGYGTKADILSACRFNQRDMYELGQIILNGDEYDATNPKIMDLLDNVRKNNPANVTFAQLKKYLGDDYKTFLIDVLNGKVNVITTEAPRLSNFTRYIINLFDDKNYEYFKSIDNEEFQNLLEERKSEYILFRKKNDKRAEALSKISLLPKKEQYALLDRLVKAEIQAQKDKKAEELRIKTERINQQKERMSFVSTLAWYFSPNTRDIMKNNSNSRIKEILEKHTKAKEILEGYLSGEYTREQMKALVKELKLSKNDEIALLSYYKSNWEQAGTTEFSIGWDKAKDVAEIYFNQGLEAIEDEDIKAKIIQWQEDKE